MATKIVVKFRFLVAPMHKKRRNLINFFVVVLTVLIIFFDIENVLETKINDLCSQTNILVFFFLEENII